MNRSLFADYVDKYFPKIGTIVELYNGKRQAPSYLFETMLRPELSVDQKWNTTTVDTHFVAADIVAIDSPLPLKKRDSLRVAGGDLPIMGMKMQMGAKLINDINILKAQGAKEQEIVRKVMDDAIRCVNGIKESLEALFLEGLSTGVIGVQSDNVGVSELIRLDFGYKEQNKHTASKPWDATDATPLSDIAELLDKAEGVVSVMMLDKATFNKLRKSNEAKMLVAKHSGVAMAKGATLLEPTPERFKEAFRDEYDLDIIVVNRKVTIEKNGLRLPTNPWGAGQVVFLPSAQIGALVYGQTPEEFADIAGVSKEKPLPYALLRKYSLLEPYTEVTDIRAMVAPIIEGVDLIHTLSTAEPKAVAQP